ncbi:MAG TPA: AAA family ATPase [Polyangia bacterium]|nr:AAA family ATPase [Polyangia bacterium]
MDRLYGRGEVIARTRAAVADACAGTGRLVLFTGEPGIGKSRLGEHAAAEAGERGAAVAWGRCWEAGGAPAYWPWIQLFRSLGMHEDPFAGAAADLAGGSAEARFAAFDRAVAALKALAARRPLALVLDDLHAADAPSLLLLIMLARELPRCALLVIGAYRDAALATAPETSALLARVAREGEVLPLGRLSPDDVSAWARDAGADPLDDGAIADLYRVTEGHPLFVAEALRLGRRSERQPAAPAATGAVWGPEGLGAVLDEHLGRLSPPTRAVLGAAAVLGRELSTSDLEATAGAAPDAVHAAVREAVAASILVPGAAPGRLRFSHVLLRDRLYADLPPSTRAALHGRAGAATLARGEAQIAVHHLFEGQGAARPELTAEAALVAGEALLSRLAFEDAVRLGRRSLDLPGLPAPLACQLRLVVAEGLIRLGDGAEGKALCVAAADEAAHMGAPQLFARAALVYGTELASGTVEDRMVDLLRRALAMLPDGDSPLRARVTARLCAALTPPRRPADLPEIVALMREATAMARRMGDRHALLYVLQYAATVGALVPEEERLDCMAETVALARSLGQRLVLAQTLPTFISALLAAGDRARAEAALAEYEQLIADSSRPFHRLRQLLVRVLFSALDGDFDEAERLSAQALSIAQSSGSAPARLTWLIQRLTLAELQGRPELLAPESAALLEQAQIMPASLPYAAWILIGLGQRDDAAALLRRLDVARPDAPAPSAASWELFAAGESCVLLGDVELAQILYPRAARNIDRMFWNLGPGSLLGPTSLMLGDLARLVGRRDEALAHYDRAIAFCERLRAPRLVERCRRARAATLALDPAAPIAAAAAIAAAAPIAAAARSEVAPSPVALLREGEIWTLLGPDGTSLRLRHSKGLQYLDYLLERPGRDVHVLELAGLEHQAGDAGVVLDARAKEAYRRRLDDLRDQAAEAERFGDGARAARAQQEIEALAEQLAGAVGLGGRDRRAASEVERARVNVQRRIRDALDRVAAADPALGRRLAAAIKTGTYCSYQPL